MDCKNISQLMTDKLAGEIQEVDMKVLDDHLKTCENCRQEFQEMQELWNLTALTLKSEKLDDELSNAQINALFDIYKSEQELNIKTPETIPFKVKIRRFWPQIAALIIMTFIVTTYWNYPDVANDKSMVPPEEVSEDIEAPEVDAVKLTRKPLSSKFKYKKRVIAKVESPGFSEFNAIQMANKKFKDQKIKAPAARKRISMEKRDNSRLDTCVLTPLEAKKEKSPVCVKKSRSSIYVQKISKNLPLLSNLVDNYDYSYPMPTKSLVGVTISGTISPFATQRHLLKIGLQSKKSISKGTLKNLFVNVEFNTKFIKNNCQLGGQSSKDKGRCSIQLEPLYSGKARTLLFSFQFHSNIQPKIPVALVTVKYTSKNANKVQFQRFEVFYNDVAKSFDTAPDVLKLAVITTEYMNNVKFKKIRFCSKRCSSVKAKPKAPSIRRCSAQIRKKAIMLKYLSDLLKKSYKNDQKVKALYQLIKNND